jgi:hypothetical protein
VKIQRTGLKFEDSEIGDEAATEGSESRSPEEFEEFARVRN